MLLLSITILASGLLVFLACLPIIHRKIPRNGIYGMRTKHTFESEESWYHLNEVGGMIFAMLGFPLILGGILGFFISAETIEAFSIIVLAVTFLSVAAALYFFCRYSARYTAEKAPAVVRIDPDPKH